MMDVDFSRLERRRQQTDYDSTCPHDPDCEVYESSNGPVPVCLLGDHHLLNAFRKANSAGRRPNPTRDLLLGEIRVRRMHPYD